MTVETLSEEFAIERTLDAPRDLVFRAWTEAERLAQWWGPKGFKTVVRQFDLRPGGVFRYSMHADDGFEMWAKFVYREVVRPERLVFELSFTDRDGGPARHPKSPTWPMRMLVAVAFAEAAGRTTVTLRNRAMNATPEELKTFVDGFAGMNAGFGATFDQLAAYLAHG